MTPPPARPRGHAAIEDLLGAYALDAVVGEEAEAVELHLRDCARCRATVSEYRETASLLASGHAPAAAQVWDGIAAAMDEAAPRGLQLNPVVPLRPRQTQIRNRVLFAAAAALVVVLGTQGVQQSRRIDRMQAALETQTIVAAALAAEGDPSARRAEMRTADGKLLARAVLMVDGTGFVWSEGLPRLASDRTYQLWAVLGTERISVGVLGPDPEVVAVRVSGNVVGLAITDEIAGGVVATQNQPTVTGLVTA